MAGTFALGPSVRYARAEGLGVLLDLRTSTYKVLDEVATSMLEGLIGSADLDAQLDAWCGAGGVDRTTVRSELDRFAEACLADGVLSTAAPNGGAPAERGSPPARPTRRGPQAARALHALASTWRDLRSDGFGPTYERYANIPVAPAAAAREACLKTFVRAENLWLSRLSPNDCLPRSLALFRYLRCEGVAAEHVIGVRRVPFAAHAWVEADGDALLDERIAGFTTLARLGLPGAGAAQ